METADGIYSFKISRQAHIARIMIKTDFELNFDIFISSTGAAPFRRDRNDCNHASELSHSAALISVACRNRKAFALTSNSWHSDIDIKVPQSIQMLVFLFARGSPFDRIHRQ